MARITVEDCIDKFPSRFELVLVASQRARNLHSGETSLIDKDNDKNTVIALREIAEESISVNEMKENLIEEFQTVTISDEENENLELELEMSTNDKENDESIDKNNSATEDSDIKDKNQDNENQANENQANENQANENQDNENQDNENQTNEIEEEIKELSTSEDSELQKEYEVIDDLAQSEDILSSDNDENSDNL